MAITLKTPTLLRLIYVTTGTYLFLLVISLLNFPGFLEAFKPTPISIARSNMRSLSTALESYYVDNETYPPFTYDTKFKIHWYSKLEAPTFDLRFSLSTPIAYISEYPEDPFQGGWKKGTLVYWTNGWDYLLVSLGPDRDLDTDFAMLDRLSVTSVTLPSGKIRHRIKQGAAAPFLVDSIFDSTNGSKSSGDIYRPNSQMMGEIY